MKSKGKKTVNMIQETLNHKVLFQRLHHPSVGFWLSYLHFLVEVFFRSLHNICMVIIICIDPPTGSVARNVHPLRFVRMNTFFENKSIHALNAILAECPFIL